MDYSITLDHEYKIVIYKHNGTIDSKDIGVVWKEILQLPEFSKMGYNLLSDYSDANLHFHIEKTKRIDEFLESVKHIINNKRNAVVVKNPHCTAISFLYESKAWDKFNFKVKVFYTLESAYNYLK
jgi:pantothenate kinase